MEELVGKTIENYEIVEVLGKGGMGIVYKAYDKNLDRYVAIKMLLPQVLDKSVIIERFKREAKNQAKLSHPNIVMVYGLINYEKMLGIVMEYVEGESIEAIIFRQKRLHLFDSVYIMKHTLAGIAHAHQKGFIHRDIKPSNILLSKDGEIKIMDFGISKSLFDKGMTKTGAKVGTVYYMSPEQIRGEKITHHCDIYSVGCSFYEMVAGVPPFDLDSEYEVMDAHLKKDPAKISTIVPGTPALIDKIIAKSLKKTPHERYDSAEDFTRDINDLEKYLSSINAHTELKIKKQNKTGKFLSIFAVSSLILLFVALSYFAFIKVDELIKSDTMEQFDKFDISTLFKEDNRFQNLSLVDLESSETVNSVNFLDNGFGYAVGTGGKVWMSSDAGKSWKSYNTPATTQLHDAHVTQKGNSIIVGDSSVIYFSDYFFRDLTPVFYPGNIAFFDIEFIDESIGFICGADGIILKSVDGGKTWNQTVTDTRYLIYDIKFIDDEVGFAVGWAGTILKTTDAGERWTSYRQLTQKYIKSVDFSDDSHGLAVGGNELFVTNNAGETWENIELPSNLRGMQDIKFVDDDVAFIVGNKGLLMATGDGGRSWSSIESNIFVDFKKIVKYSENQIFVAGNNGKILKIN